MSNKKIMKILNSILAICVIIISSYKVYDYLQRKMLFKNASSTAEIFNFKFEYDVGYMPIKDKKSLKNLNDCMNVLHDVYRKHLVHLDTLPFYAEYLCKQYRDGKLNYTIWIDNKEINKNGFKYILTTQKPNHNLTKELQLDLIKELQLDK